MTVLGRQLCSRPASSPSEQRTWVVPSVLVATLVCLLLCGAGHALPAFASNRSSFTVSTNYLGPSDASRRALARADAVRLTSLAWYPPGARRLSTWIHQSGFEMSEPAASIGDPDQEDVTRFYLSGPSSQGLSWLNTRVPSGATLDGYGGPDRANLEWSYSFPSSPILPQSVLQYSKRILPDGNVELRIDAQVAWTPQKSRFSIIPSGAVLVRAVFFVSGATNEEPKTLMSSTTNTATIAAIRRQINALPAVYPGINSCPAEEPGSITVQFFKPARARSFASVHFSSSNCGWVQVSEFTSSHRLVGEGDDGGGYDAVPSVVKLLGLKSPV